MARIAFYTFGILRQPMGHEQVQGFFDRIDSVFTQAESSEGFIGRNRELRGEYVSPRFFDKNIHAAAPATLSWWKDLESVCAFAYRGMHGEAMKHRHDWFLDSYWPTYVAWWIDDNHEPSRDEACRKLEYLHDNGVSASAFDFKNPFNAGGIPVSLDRELMKMRIDSNNINS